MENNHTDDLTQYMDMWDAACAPGGAFEPQEIDTPPKSPVPIWNHASDVNEFDDVDEMDDSDFSSEDSLMQEAVADPNARKSPNPVYPDSIGKDSLRPKSSSKNDDAFLAIDKLKRQLHQLECDLIGKETGGTKWPEKAKLMFDTEDDSGWEAIQNLKEKINDLSDQLGFLDEPTRSVYGFDNEEVGDK